LIWSFIGVSLKVTKLRSYPVLYSYPKQGLVFTVRLTISDEGTMKNPTSEMYGAVVQNSADVSFGTKENRYEVMCLIVKRGETKLSVESVRREAWSVQYFREDRKRRLNRC